MGLGHSQLVHRMVVHDLKYSLWMGKQGIKGMALKDYSIGRNIFWSLWVIEVFFVEVKKMVSKSNTLTKIAF